MASSGVFVDSVRMVIGYIVMFLHAMVVLGKRNRVTYRLNLKQCFRIKVTPVTWSPWFPATGVCCYCPRMANEPPS